MLNDIPIIWDFVNNIVIRLKKYKFISSISVKQGDIDYCCVASNIVPYVFNNAHDFYGFLL